MNTAPTIGFNCERVRAALPSNSEEPGSSPAAKSGSTTTANFQVWDVGGQEKARPLWRPYTRATDAVVFVVDSSDQERMEEARMELHRIMRVPDNSGTPVLLLANKQDLPGALSPAEVALRMRSSELRQPCRLAQSCAVTGEGLDVALADLRGLILDRRRRAGKRARNKTR